MPRPKKTLEGLSPLCPLPSSQGCSYIGDRSENQDVFLIHDAAPCPFWGVMDGHGFSGDVGAAIARDVVEQCLTEKLEAMMPSVTLDGVKAAITESFLFVSSQDLLHSRKADEEIKTYSQELELEEAENGTTATVAVLIPSGEIVIAWVGDSPCLFARQLPGGVIQILFRSEDHTLFNPTELHRLQENPSASVVNAPSGRRLIPPPEVIPLDIIKRRKLSLNMARALGHRTLSVHGVLPQPEFSPALPVEPGDRLLICSDGLLHGMKDISLAERLYSARTPNAECMHLLRASDRFDDQRGVLSDNTTCVCVFFGCRRPCPKKYRHKFVSTTVVKPSSLQIGTSGDADIKKGKRKTDGDKDEDTNTARKRRRKT